MMSERKQRRERKKRLLRLILLLFTIGLVSFFIRGRHNHAKQTVVLSETVKQAQTTTPPSPTIAIEENNANSPGLSTAVANQLIGTKGKYAIVIKNLKTGETYQENEHRTYAAGSLYKLWVMAVVYEQIREQKLHENDILSEKVTTLNKLSGIDNDTAEKKDGTIRMSVSEALEKMITVSDNYAALLLTEKVTVRRISDFLQRNGFSESIVGMQNKAPVTTASDIAAFFQKLYDGTLVEKGISKKMLTLLKEQRLNEKIPKYLPTATVIAHKTGELDGFTHDAGIVYAPNATYIIVLLSESDSRELANERLANVSKGVYDYFVE